eukprot:473617-Pyramimonas_sp.AAC.1
MPHAGGREGGLPDVVIYEPKGDGFGEPYDVFKYQAFDGEELSYRQGVLVTVTPVPDVPRVESFTAVMSEEEVEAGLKKIRLRATDADHPSEPLLLTLTTLPALGALHQCDARGGVGAKIETPGETVAHPDGYVPRYDEESGETTYVR